jgi:putative SOS response-associated peptidase YedK
MDRVTSIDELQSLLLPYDETLMHEHHVSTLVNSTRNQGAEVPAPA